MWLGGGGLKRRWRAEKPVTLMSDSRGNHHESRGVLLTNSEAPHQQRSTQEGSAVLHYGRNESYYTVLQLQ